MRPHWAAPYSRPCPRGCGAAGLGGGCGHNGDANHHQCSVNAVFVATLWMIMTMTMAVTTMMARKMWWRASNGGEGGGGRRAAEGDSGGTTIQQSNWEVKGWGERMNVTYSSTLSTYLGTYILRYIYRDWKIFRNISDQDKSRLLQWTRVLLWSRLSMATHF
jgi:hypothetical protein